MPAISLQKSEKPKNQKLEMKRLGIFKMSETSITLIKLNMSYSHITTTEMKCSISLQKPEKSNMQTL